MKASELDKKFDDNQEDILEYFDTSKIKMINEEPKRVNIDFPAWMIHSLDKEASNSSVAISFSSFIILFLYFTRSAVKPLNSAFTFQNSSWDEVFTIFK